ncbi:MAG: hypothetical protein LBB75_05140 [Oscillospiraceae bacterium]|jgi:hypothetical protein|nr:hypothetical protein [Oscillospiraceae bacterium]
MKKLLTAFTISAYLVPVAIVATLFLAYVFSDAMADAPAFAMILAFIPLLLFVLLPCALSLASMIRALRAAKEAQPLPFRNILSFKLRMIPFYMLDFVCFAAFGMMIMGPWGMMLIPLACGHIWWVMAGLSAHSIAKLLILHRQNGITKRQFVFHCLLQLVFAWDLLDSIYLTKREKKPEGEPHPL